MLQDFLIFLCHTFFGRAQGEPDQNQVQEGNQDCKSLQGTGSCSSDGTTRTEKVPKKTRIFITTTASTQLHQVGPVGSVGGPMEAEDQTQDEVWSSPRICPSDVLLRRSSLAVPQNVLKVSSLGKPNRFWFWTEVQIKQNIRTFQSLSGSEK